MPPAISSTRKARAASTTCTRGKSHASDLHLRDNPAGITKDLWYHDMGCSSWLRVTRNTITHEIHAVDLVADLKGAKA